MINIEDKQYIYLVEKLKKFHEYVGTEVISDENGNEYFLENKEESFETINKYLQNYLKEENITKNFEDEINNKIDNDVVDYFDMIYAEGFLVFNNIEDIHSCIEKLPPEYATGGVYEIAKTYGYSESEIPNAFRNNKYDKFKNIMDIVHSDNFDLYTKCIFIEENKSLIAEVLNYDITDMTDKEASLNIFKNFSAEIEQLYTKYLDSYNEIFDFEAMKELIEEIGNDIEEYKIKINNEVLDDLGSGYSKFKNENIIVEKGVTSFYCRLSIELNNTTYLMNFNNIMTGTNDISVEDVKEFLNHVKSEAKQKENTIQIGD